MLEMTREQVERFWTSCRQEGNCLIWTKSKRRNGYGQVKLGGRNRTTHRVAYELVHGTIPEGLLIDHSCRRRACINPDHLRLATVKQNAENRDDAPATTSGIRGVRWDKARGCWAAAVTHNYQTINLGRFSDLIEAGQVAHATRESLFTHAI